MTSPSEELGATKRSKGSRGGGGGSLRCLPRPRRAASRCRRLPMTQPHQVDEAAAHVSADAWVGLVDQARYAESWDAAAPIFQASMTKEHWDGAVKGARGPLGPLASQKFRAAEYKASLPGAPEGEYVVIYYDSAFAEKSKAPRRPSRSPRPPTMPGRWRATSFSDAGAPAVERAGFAPWGGVRFSSRRPYMAEGRGPKRLRIRIELE